MAACSRGFGLLRQLLRPISAQALPSRHYPTARKRFYKRTSVLDAGGGLWEVTLDQKRVRTPAGDVLRVENESLALALSHEWDLQKETISMSTMHLHGLVCTATDNPNRLTKMDLATSIIQFLETDTVLFHSEDPPDLVKLQTDQWEPVIDWFNLTMNTSIKPTTTISPPEVREQDKQQILRWLLSHSFLALHGISYSVDVLKSVIIGAGVAHRKLGVSEAVLLSRLEEDFQATHWGRVEWSHDLAQEDAQARVAAAAMLTQLSTPSVVTASKAQANN